MSDGIGRCRILFCLIIFGCLHISCIGHFFLLLCLFQNLAFHGIGIHKTPCELSAALSQGNHLLFLHLVGQADFEGTRDIFHISAVGFGGIAFTCQLPGIIRFCSFY